MKYQNEPDKFFESEAQVNEIVTKLGAIEAYP
jgi:beta-catenin-like protein 1